MERFRAGLRKGDGGRGKAAAITKPTALPGKGKFKLRDAKDPLPLLTDFTKKPKAKFFKPATSSATADKPNGTKSGLFGATAFLRPIGTEEIPKVRTPFTFKNFQLKSGGPKTSNDSSLGKTAPQDFGGTKPLLSKFSVKSLAKKSSNIATEAGAKPDKGHMLKPPAKRSVPSFALCAETKSSAAKKRKAVDLPVQEIAFPNKSGQTKSSGFKLKSFTLNKEKATGKECGMRGIRNDNVQLSGFRDSFSVATKAGAAVVEANDGTILKKRTFSFTSTESGPAPKKKKRPTQLAALRENTSNLAKEKVGTGECDGSLEKEDPGLPPLAPPGFISAQTSSAGESTGVVQPGIVTPRSPDYQEECSLGGIEEELAVKLLCALGDDEEDEFLTRSAAIEEFTDRVGREQQQIRKRLLDAHADVSETLLDALTSLMAEEGGIGMDKLDFDMSIDVDVGDAFLQNDVIELVE